MAASLKNGRKKASVQPSVHDLLLALAKAVGTDHTQEYNPDTFASMWVDLYSNGDEESYQEQGAYVHNLLQQLEVALLTNTVVPTQRTTTVWYQGSLQVVSLTDTELVDVVTDVQQGVGASTELRRVLDTDNKNLLFLAVTFNE